MSCTQENTNLNEELVIPSASSSPHTLPSSPIPNQSSAIVKISPPVLLPTPSSNSLDSESILIHSKRCDKKGELTASNEVRLQTIQTRPNFTQQDVNKPRFLCHHNQNDTLLITNATEVLEFNPRTSELKTLIDSQATGFKHNGSPDFKFQSLRECLIDKEGFLYLVNGQTQKIKRVDLQQKTIQTLHRNSHTTKTSDSQFSLLTDFALTAKGEALIADTNNLYRIDELNTVLLFQTAINAAPVYKGTFPQQLSPSSLSVKADLTTIGAIATDQNNNIYMTNSHQGAFLKLTPDNFLFLVDPKGIKTLENESRSTFRVGSLNNMVFSDKYNVFFGKYDDFSTDNFVITRDGCVGLLDIKSDKNEGVLLTDFASTNDGTLYAIDSKNLQLVRLEVPPDLPEKAQWEPPQAWKDATGME